MPITVWLGEQATSGSTGFIGVGWVYKGKLLTNFEDVEGGQHFEATVQPRISHAKAWSRIQRQFKELEKYSHTFLPRFRVIYVLDQHKYFVIGTPALLKVSKFQTKILQEFNLPASTVFANFGDSAEHYRGENGSPYNVLQEQLDYFN